MIHKEDILFILALWVLQIFLILVCGGLAPPIK